jgi:hypothetical protein
MNENSRPVFVLRVRAQEGVDEIRALRGWLKRGLRDFGLVCVEAYQEQERGGCKMSINYADADDQGLLPFNVYQLKAKVILGGHGEDSTLTLASSGLSLHLALACTVTDEDEYRGRKIYDNVTVALTAKSTLPSVDPEKLEKLQTAVRMGRAKIKALLNSARGLDPNDKSEATEAKRAVETHDDLTGMIFWAEIGEEPARGSYAARNKIERIVEPCDDDYPPKKTARAAAKVVVLPPQKSLEDDLADSIPFSAGDEG